MGIDFALLMKTPTHERSFYRKKVELEVVERLFRVSERIFLHTHCLSKIVAIVSSIAIMGIVSMISGISISLWGSFSITPLASKHIPGESIVAVVKVRVVIPIQTSISTGISIR